MPESYLENALLKLARQLVAFDEASLMDLWDRYAEAVRQFEPSRRWEEDALIFGLIQAVRMKNQLFNHNLSASRRPQGAGPNLGLLDLTAPDAAPEARKQAEGQPAPAQGNPGQPGQPGQPGRTGGAPRGSVRQGKPKAGKLIPLRRGED